MRWYDLSALIYFATNIGSLPFCFLPFLVILLPAFKLLFPFPRYFGCAEQFFFFCLCGGDRPQCYWIGFNGSVGLCIRFALETCAQLRLGQNTIHLHLMATGCGCGELWTTTLVCVCVCVWEKAREREREILQGQMLSEFNECGPKGTWVVKTESWRDYFVPCYLTLQLHL